MKSRASAELLNAMMPATMTTAGLISRKNRGRSLTYVSALVACPSTVCVMCISVYTKAQAASAGYLRAVKIVQGAATAAATSATHIQCRTQSARAP